MTTLPRSRRSHLFRTLRGAGGFPLLLLCACTVGIDDRPVPPESIPNVAFSQSADAGSYDAPVVSAASMKQPAAPAYSDRTVQPSRGNALVWQTGAQPVAVERAALSAPEPASSDVESEPAEPSAAGEDEATQSEPAQAEAAEEPAPEQAAAVQPAETHSFRLAPFVGLDADAAAPLREALQAEAARQGIELGIGAEKLVLKGYLSSMEDSGAHVLTYVWDVYDTSGNRLTRIDGQQKLPRGAQTEPLRVDAATAGKVAKKIMATLAAWRPDAPT